MTFTFAVVILFNVFDGDSSCFTVNAVEV